MFETHTGRPRTILGMIHLKPLPGTPFYVQGSLQRILDEAVTSAQALQRGGASGCLVQTVDRVYSVKDESDPARIAAISLIVHAVVGATGDGFQVGVHMLRNAVRPSLAVAKVTGADFVRAGAVVGQTLTAHGMVQPDPQAVMEYRQKIDAQSVGIIADVDSMHFTWYGEPKATAEVARAAHGIGADAVCLGQPDERRTLDLISSVRRAVPGLPVYLAGYSNHDNAARLLRDADGAFVGSCLERGGWGGVVDVDQVARYMDIVHSLGSATVD